jgi:hypothetical protein
MREKTLRLRKIELLKRT